MSSLLVPPHVARAVRNKSGGAMSRFAAAKAPDVAANEGLDAEINAPIPVGIPQPHGWGMTIVQIGLREKSKGGLILSDHIVHDQTWRHRLAKVLAMGSACYKGDQWRDVDPATLPTVGSLILFNPRGCGEPVWRFDVPYWIINDDHWAGSVSREHAHGYKFFEGMET